MHRSVFSIACVLSAIFVIAEPKAPLIRRDVVRDRQRVLVNDILSQLLANRFKKQDDIALRFGKRTMMELPSDLPFETQERWERTPDIALRFGKRADSTQNLGSEKRTEHAAAQDMTMRFG